MAPFTMLVPCLGGMAIGLAIDCASTPPEVLASLCSASGAFLARMRLHWAVFPATHALMLLGAVVAVVVAELRRASVRRDATIRGLGARTCAHAACLAAMLAGMAAGGELGPLLSAGLDLSAFAGLIAAMVLGMIGGAALTAPLARDRRPSSAAF